MSVDDEPWRERPPSCARCLTPGAPQRVVHATAAICQGPQTRHAISPSSSARSLRIVTERSADNLAEMQSKIDRAFTRDFHNRSTSAQRLTNCETTTGEHTIVSDANVFGRDERGRIRRPLPAMIFATIYVLSVQADVEWLHSVTAHALQGAMCRPRSRRRAHPPARSRAVRPARKTVSLLRRACKSVNSSRSLS